MKHQISLLEGKRIILGVTGSIACYKAIDLASRLTQASALVDTIMTESATHFVNSLSFHTVTGRPAYHDMWAVDDHVKHVRFGEEADLVIIAPATANTIAKLAAGLADNLLTVTVLAARCPMLIAPAMDGAMYENSATQANLKSLHERGVIVIEPATGRMASGLAGRGRLPEPHELVGHVRLALGRSGALAQRHIVVSAGPTEEPLDPVRYLSNRSSGKQGFALAQAALDAGAKVTLVSGPVGLESPQGVELIQVRTALEMHDAVINAVRDADALIMAAAVSDFRPSDNQKQKIKKGSDQLLELKLNRNPDILEAVWKQKSETGFPRVTMGFAAETTDTLRYGRKKLDRKGLDFIAINDVSSSRAGFVTDTNQVVLIASGGTETSLPLQSKVSIAEQLIRTLAESLQ